MSTLALAPVTASPTVKFGNLLRAESRKLVDSISAKIFLGVVVVLSLVLAILVPLAAMDQIRELGGAWHEFVEIAASGPSIFVPILALMLFTAEWSQNSVLSTFVSEPRRGRVLLAKTIATFVLALATWLASIGAGAVIALVFDQATSLDISWALDEKRLVGNLLVMLLTTFEGAALGILLMNTPVAIVTYLVIPMLVGILPSISTEMTTLWEWIAPSAPAPFLSTLTFEGDNLLKLLACVGLWVILPGVLGWIRQTRAEVS